VVGTAEKEKQRLETSKTRSQQKTKKNKKKLNTSQACMEKGEGSNKQWYKKKRAHFVRYCISIPIEIPGEARQTERGNEGMLSLVQPQREGLGSGGHKSLRRA